MYLKKEENKVVITDYEDLLTRLIRQIPLIVQGQVKDSSIYFDLEKRKIRNLINFLNSNEIDFSIDAGLQDVLEHYQSVEHDFNTHTKSALEIKYNLNESSRMYVSFLNTLKSLMTRRLYDHQAKAAFHMAFSHNSCNFSVPGAGKTSIVYAAYAYLKKQNSVDKLLVIGPLSSYLAWKEEFKQCFGIEPNIVNLSEYNREQKNNYLEQYKGIQSEITFINYEGFNGIRASMIHYLKKNKIMVILDEAHKIKNPVAQRSQSVMSFAKNAVSRVVLTGTPIPNGYRDLYNLFEFVWPGKNIVGFNPNQLQLMSTEYSYRKLVKVMMDNIDPYYIRIAKKTLNLPEPIFNKPLYIRMGSVQQEIYDFVAEDYLKDDSENYDDELRNELKKAKLVRLMQTVTNPGAIAESLKRIDIGQSEIYDKIVNYAQYENPPKYLELLRLVNSITDNGGKVIIWTQYTYNIKTLRSFLTSKGLNVDTLFGEINNHDREEIIRKFHELDSLKIIIANPAAVAESISLHRVCHNAIYIDKSFNAAHYMQSKDRIHRVGLKPSDKINYYFLLSENTIDEVIHSRVLDKEASMLEVIEGKEVPLFSDTFDSDFSNDDIIAIDEYLNSARKRD